MLGELGEDLWPAERHLPAAPVPVYVGTWAAYTIAQRPPLSGVAARWAGCFEGVRGRAHPGGPSSGAPYGG